MGIDERFLFPKSWRHRQERGSTCRGGTEEECTSCQASPAACAATEMSLVRACNGHVFPPLPSFLCAGYTLYEAAKSKKA
jgi:hypothetical protein